MNKIYKAFPGGKHKVLTLSYDDGKVQDRRLVKIFNKYGIKATFNLNSGLTDMKNRIPKEEWTSLYAGHEVAVHTVTHPTIARCPSPEIFHEIYDDKMEIEKVRELMASSLDGMKNEIVINKTLEFLVDKSTVKRAKKKGVNEE